MKKYDVRWDNDKHLEALERRRMKELDREKRAYSRYWSEDEDDKTSKDVYPSTDEDIKEIVNEMMSDNPDVDHVEKLIKYRKENGR